MGMVFCCYEQGHLVYCRSVEPVLPASITATAAANAGLLSATADSSRSTGTGMHVSAAECEDSATSACQPAAASTGARQHQDPKSHNESITAARLKLDNRRIDLGALHVVRGDVLL
jgi:hypothetical protein